MNRCPARDFRGPPARTLSAGPSPGAPLAVCRRPRPTGPGAARPGCGWTATSQVAAGPSTAAATTLTTLPSTGPQARRPPGTGSTGTGITDTPMPGRSLGGAPMTPRTGWCHPGQIAATGATATARRLRRPRRGRRQSPPHLTAAATAAGAAAASPACSSTARRAAATGRSARLRTSGRMCPRSRSRRPSPPSPSERRGQTLTPAPRGQGAGTSEWPGRRRGRGGCPAGSCGSLARSALHAGSDAAGCHRGFWSHLTDFLTTSMLLATGEPSVPPSAIFSQTSSPAQACQALRCSPCRTTARLDSRADAGRRARQTLSRLAGEAPREGRRLRGGRAISWVPGCHSFVAILSAWICP
mmetsp:Transcript_29524/g.70318  ORF Transcript_29524/g.70318 Transcript_29524/m.70318 type:complete len:356 (+) Transcript_29524:986-2053(+)